MSFDPYKITIELDFMERDTLLAALKDLIKMKKDIDTVLSKTQAKIAQELFDKIYDQKKRSLGYENVCFQI